jgi:hypothetical protein
MIEMGEKKKIWSLSYHHSKHVSVNSNIVLFGSGLVGCNNPNLYRRLACDLDMTHILP